MSKNVSSSSTSCTGVKKRFENLMASSAMMGFLHVPTKNKRVP
jgi:hypothetical protein